MARAKHCPIIALFVWLISHQSAVLFSQNKSDTSNQPTVLFSQKRPAPAISQPNSCSLRHSLNINSRTVASSSQPNSCSLRHSLNINSRTVASSPALKRVATNGTLRRRPRVQVEPARSILAVPPQTQRLPRPPRWLGLPLPSSPSVITFHESRGTSQ
jgi:hypothetical protein